MWCNSYRADDRGFESNQTLCNWYLLLEISAKYPRVRIESKDWLVRNQDTVSKWSSMSTRGLQFQ